MLKKSNILNLLVFSFVTSFTSITSGHSSIAAATLTIIETKITNIGPRQLIWITVKNTGARSMDLKEGRPNIVHVSFKERTFRKALTAPLARFERVTLRFITNTNTLMDGEPTRIHVEIPSLRHKSTHATTPRLHENSQNLGNSKA